MKTKTILKSLAYLLLFFFIVVLFFNYMTYRNGYRANTDVQEADDINWVLTDQGYIHIKTYGQPRNRDSVNLVFVIHGDAPFNKPGYQYIMAEKIASGMENTISVAILRPGYTDPQGHTSNGVRGLAVGDNYTPEVIEAISEVMEIVKGKYDPVKTTIVGHSGGAAITANLIGTKPGLTDAAVLVSCPCNLTEWRKHMRKKQPFSPWWYIKTESISPDSVAENVSKDTEIMIISGTDDPITSINLSKEYHKILTSLDFKAGFVPLPDEGHEILLHNAVFDHIKNTIHNP